MIMNDDLQKVKPGLLLHVCCAPCSAYVTDGLRKSYELTLYFANPNIYPQEEYTRRRDEARRWADGEGLRFMDEEYNPEQWRGRIMGLEDAPERGARCEVCFTLRLEMAAAKARELGVSYFGTVLSVSPHKDAAVINRVGQAVAEGSGAEFIQADYKKKEGFKLSMAKARELGLYRQDYCGCVYSQRRPGREQG